MNNTARGTFEIQATRQPPYDGADGVVLARTHFDKQFSGDLVATSTVEMTAAGTPTPGSAAYVALERVTGALGGREGSFVLVHLGIMDRGSPSLQVRVVPDSGTGGLVGIRGDLSIEITGGQHHYTFDYELDG